MTDHLNIEARSALMSRIGGRNTNPELVVRSLVHALGYRYRLHVRSLPGTPDLVFSSRRKIIFVNGCFWHGHEGCTRSKLPKTNVSFWAKKIVANCERDRKNCTKLKELGWKILVIWECEIRDRERLEKNLVSFLKK